MAHGKIGRGSLLLVIALFGGPLSACAPGDAPAEDTRALDSALCHAGYIESLYHDVLGREPDADGLAYWQDVFDSGGSRRDIALGFLKSDEYHKLFMTKAYQTYLRREPDEAGLSDYVASLANGQIEETVTASLLASDEYFANVCGYDFRAFVGMLYKDVLGRDGSSDEVDLWAGTTLSREEMARKFIQSEEYHAHVLTSFYAQYLERAPDEGGLADWMAALANGITLEQARAGFLASEEYYSSCDANAADDGSDSTDGDDGDSSVGGECGDIDEIGICKGDVNVYCDGGSLVEYDCAADGDICNAGYCEYSGDDGDPDPDNGGGAACGSVTDAGTCNGTVLSYCDGGELFTYDCADDGTTCGPIEDYYDCE